VTVPSFVYRWPTRDLERVDQGVDFWPSGSEFELSRQIAQTSEFHTFISKLSHKPASPTLRLFRFNAALGSSVMTFQWPRWQSHWRPWRPYDWERDGWL
jgi:hypothetical protein